MTRDDISWLPRWMNRERVECFEVVGRAGIRWRCARPENDAWGELGAGLSQAHQALRAMRTKDIVHAIDTVANRWLDRTFEARRAACAEVQRATGFSEQAVERSFDVELTNYRADPLLRVLRRELGSATALDGFVGCAELDGRTFAIGPRTTLSILTGNVPGLPALSIVRSLLVKSTVIAKVASGEPTFAARFAQTLAEVEPRLGDAIAITYWPRSDTAPLSQALAISDAVITYGSDEACASIRQRVGHHQRYIEHGHKLSAVVVSEGYLRVTGAAEVARRIAVDVSTFNQHACIAPQLVVVEADEAGARRFAAQLGDAMDAHARTCPLGSLDDDDAGALQLRRVEAAWRAASRADHDLWTGAGLDWTVTLDSGLDGMTGGGNRVVRVVPVTQLDEAVTILQPIAGHLQNVGLGATRAELWSMAESLARLGACRVSEPGRMAEPSMMWRHDGRMCIAELVRWCDVEMHQLGRPHAEAAGGHR